MASRIQYVEPERPKQRRPRVTDERHLAAIRSLQCLVCGSAPVEAAHIRTGSIKHGKRPVGVGERPSDLWTVPLCHRCHRTGPEAQHAGNELAFYQRHRIDPFATALALWAASGDFETMMSIVKAARQ